MTSNKKSSLIVSGVLAGISVLGLGIYYFFKRDTRDILSLIPTGDPQDFKQDLLKLKINVEDGHYSIKSMTSVFTVIKRFLKPYIDEEKKSNQEERKNNLNDVPKYIALNEEYTDKILQVWQEAAELALEILEIDKTKWAADIDYYIIEGNQDIAVLADYFPYSVDFLTNSEDRYPAIGDIKEILTAQIKFLTEEVKTLIPHLNCIKTFRELKTLVRTRSFDFVYDKYGIAPEHINYLLCRIQDDELKKLLGAFEFLLGETVSTLEDLMIAKGLQKFHDLDILNKSK